MTVDIMRLAELVGALSVLLGAFVAIYKFIVSVKKQDEAITRIKNEQTIQMYAIRACLEGLRQQGCNGRVTEAIDRVDKYLNQAAHH